MSLLKTKLESGQFAVTAEMAPPKGCDFSHQMHCAELIKGRVDAVNVTDFQSASLKASSLGLCIKLKQAGLEPVLQMTGRDRSRMAIQGDLLSAAAFGIENVLTLTGDHTTVGDCKCSKPVFDLDSVSMLTAVKQLEAGFDAGGNKLQGEPPVFFLGSSVTPEYEPLELHMYKYAKKVAEGAKFFQTQGVYSLEPFKRFMDYASKYDAYVLAGIIPLKSAGAARYMNKNVPGINVPDDIIQRMKESSDPVKEGILIAAEMISEIKAQGLCHGVHIMAIGAEENVPLILDEAGL
ncbi:MAG: 5,10-methylenetetrahydrofolate reductase [Anaerofustis stercorihominis]|nr:5,10-methylenetetrahydrofolate reductase [Anaerofustis stercorihominis]